MINVIVTVLVYMTCDHIKKYKYKNFSFMGREF